MLEYSNQKRYPTVMHIAQKNYFSKNILIQVLYKSYHQVYFLWHILDTLQYIVEPYRKCIYFNVCAKCHTKKISIGIEIF